MAETLLPARAGRLNAHEPPPVSDVTYPQSLRASLLNPCFSSLDIGNARNLISGKLSVGLKVGPERYLATLSKVPRVVAVGKYDALYHIGKWRSWLQTIGLLLHPFNFRSFMIRYSSTWGENKYPEPATDRPAGNYRPNAGIRTEQDDPPPNLEVTVKLMSGATPDRGGMSGKDKHSVCRNYNQHLTSF